MRCIIYLSCLSKQYPFTCITTCGVLCTQLRLLALPVLPHLSAMHCFTACTHPETARWKPGQNYIHQNLHWNGHENAAQIVQEGYKYSLKSELLPRDECAPCSSAATQESWSRSHDLLCHVRLPFEAKHCSTLKMARSKWWIQNPTSWNVPWQQRVDT